METIWDKTDQELSQEIAKNGKTAIETQTLALLEMLKLIGEEVQKNKSVTVENIIRQVIGEVSVKKPDWINLLIPDLIPLQKKLDYIASAIIRKEVVKKMDFNRPSWLDEIKPKDIVFPENKEAEKINPLLKEILKAIEEKEITEKVEITNPIEIKEPKWFKPFSLDKYIEPLGKFFNGLQKKIFNIKGSVEIENPVKEVTILNPQKEVSITNLKKLEGLTELMTAQLRALGSTVSNGGNSGGATEAKQDDIISAIGSIVVPAPVGGATSEIQTDGTQKTQIVDAGGEQVTVTGGKLDVNASVDTTGLALEAGNLATIKTNTDKIPDLGQALAAASVPVVLTAAQLTTLTPPAQGLTDTQLRATAVPVSVATIPSHAVTNAGTFAVQATLAAETTKVIGTVNVASSQSIAVTQATAGNLNCTEANSGAIKTAVELIDNAISGSEMQVDVVASLPAGTNAIGKLAANSGVDIGDVTINNSTGASAVNIQDGGNTITVDGTVAVTNADIATIAGAVSGTEMQCDVLTMPTVTVAHSITGVGHGVKVVTTAGTDVALATSTVCKKVDIQAQTDNTSAIAVGGAGVDATVATGTGILLNPGDVYSLEIDNLADIYIDALVNGEGVRFCYYT